MCCCLHLRSDLLTFMSHVSAPSGADFVNVFDGNDVTATQIAHLHGQSLPSPVTGSGHVMVVQFTTDGSVTRDGFHGMFACGDPAPPSPPDACSTGLRLTPRDFVSGQSVIDRTGGHDHGLDCRWILDCTAAGAIMVPHLDFTNFDTESNFDL